jgi:hypothetical protein
MITPMSLDELLAYGLAKPGAWRDEPWGDGVVAKVGTRIFASLRAVGVHDQRGIDAGTAGHLSRGLRPAGSGYWR